MGCFLACFGFKDEKKRRRKKKNPKPSNNSYVPLHSNASIQQSFTTLPSQIKEKSQEPAIVKLKKKVRFNLNVKAYEPIPDDDDVHIYLSEDEDEAKFDNVTADLHYEEEDVITSTIESYTASYRYQNCRESDDDDEDDGLKLDSDLDDDQDIDDVCSNNSDDLNRNQFIQQETSLVDLLESKSRSQYVSSVLNPVENLSQWRLVKAKAAPMLQKENVNVMLKKDRNSLTSSKIHYEAQMNDRRAVAVDGSPMTWLGSLGTRPAYQALQPK